MTWAILLPLILAVLHYLLAVRHYGLLSPDGLFVCTQMLMVVGTAMLVEPESPVDARYLRIVVTAVSLYIVSSSFTYLCLRSRPDHPYSARDHRRGYHVRLVRPQGQVLVVTVLSLAAILAYFAAVGYSAFLLGLKGQLSGNPVDVATLRLQSYAGDAYLAPGYANQFKNVLFPALVTVILTWAFSRPGLFARLGGVVLAAIAVFALLGNGQRGAFFLFLVTLAIYVLVVNRRRMSRWTLLLPVMGVPLALLATYALGRSAGLADDPFGATSQELYKRFLNDNQMSGLAAFRYTETLPVQYGAEWYRALRGILPSDRGSTLPNEVFATLYGSMTGTAPPSMWGSVHFNFGTFGVLVFAVVLGVCLQALSFHTLRRPTYNTLELIGYAGVTATLGTWAVSGPDALLNLGIVTYLLIWWWGARWNRLGLPAVTLRQRRRSPEPAPTSSTTDPPVPRPAVPAG
ncbi:O-antigen polymerase [Micromonospora chalcea]|uniref:O-antigen polymerase n=1 Tax=Micromonospora chalcea TaxID=1874 RepID=UPI003D73DDCC